MPGRWRPWTPLGVWLATHILFAGFPAKLWREQVAARLGPDAIGLFATDGPGTSGSNGWLVAGERTITGHAVIAGDPHRYIEDPGVYQQIGRHGRRHPAPGRGTGAGAGRGQPAAPGARLGARPRMAGMARVTTAGLTGGVAVMANQRGPAEPLGVEFAPPHRAERIAALLAGRAIARFLREGFRAGPVVVLPEVDLPDVYLPEQKAQLAFLTYEVAFGR
ncbi:hypothetical protein GCM10009535_47850 [Streptomyces thermocarboxydovorans]|uniref:Uncharacterized protein n=1 Tax=Streptomyces thermocarboxydovorans TaxID=59298 RepID=A0ABN1HQ57_9ACTN